MAALMLAACSGGDPNEVGELRPYINPALGFRVDYPSNWQPVEDPDFLVGDFPDQLHAVIFLSDQASGAVFSVLVQKLDGEISLADYGEEQFAGAQSQAGDQVTYTAPVSTTLGDVEALTVQASIEQDGSTIVQRVVLAVNKGQGYGISMAAPENSLLIKTMDDMLATFGFLP